MRRFNTVMIIAGTGHRPDKLGGYGALTESRLARIAEQVLRDLAPTQVISGMALGWDQVLASVAISAGVPVIAAVPFRGQECKWPSESQARYRNILAKCAEVVEVSPPEYSSYKMHARNQWMVDRCDVVVALWNGSPGGTSACVKYALPRRLVLNYWGLLA